MHYSLSLHVPQKKTRWKEDKDEEDGREWRILGGTTGLQLHWSKRRLGRGRDKDEGEGAQGWSLGGTAPTPNPFQFATWPAAPREVPPEEMKKKGGRVGS